MHSNIGEQLLDLLRGAENEILVVAPFIKVGILDQLLNVISEKVTVTCITRWRLPELAIGVCDLEIWPSICRKQRATLWLRNDLHAKYYRVDKTCLVGSANLTAPALGMSVYNNLELMLKTDAVDSFLDVFEKDLMAGCIKVDEKIYSMVRSALSDIPQALQVVKTITSRQANESLQLTMKGNWVTWLPTLRNPQHLYPVYLGDTERLEPAIIEDGRIDLLAFDIPKGLPEAHFNKWLAIQLLQAPLVNAVDEFLIMPRRFGEVRTLLEKISPILAGQRQESTRAWQTLMRWLIHFMPDRYLYRVPHHSEILQRIDHVSTTD